MTGVALIGLGMVSRVYGEALADLAGAVTLTGVYARRRAVCDAFLADHAGWVPPDCRAYASVDEIAADPRVDFVILATPPDAREGPVQALATAGKAILMEKPVERTVEAAERLCAICEAAGVPLGIVFQHRMRPSARHLATLIAEGRLGTIEAVEVAVPWWRPQSYYDVSGRGTYGRDGGGVLISQAIHTLDLMLTLTGPVAEVIALVATTGLHRMEAEDFVSAGLRFANGAVGTLFATTASFPGGAESIRLHGTLGSAALVSNRLDIDWADGRSETIGAVAGSGGGADPMAFTSDWHRAVIADFAEALGSGRPPAVPGRSALAVHRLIAAVERSGRDGTSVRPNQGEAA